MTLTQEQLRFFEVFGFIVWRRAFSPDEISRITERFDEVLAVDRQGREFAGDKRQGVLGFVEQSRDLWSLLEDDRIHGSVEQLLGPGFVWIGSDGNLYVGNTGWHPDNASSYLRLKIAFYLDPVEKESGCLRVIPGSHREALSSRLKQRPPLDAAAESPYGVTGRDIPAFPLESTPGDIVFFNQGVFHSSYGGRTGRRMFTLNFGAKPSEESHYENLRRIYESNLGFVEKMGCTQRDRIYTDEFLHSNSPQISGMVATVLELGLR